MSNLFKIVGVLRTESEFAGGSLASITAQVDPADIQQDVQASAVPAVTLPPTTTSTRAVLYRRFQAALPEFLRKRLPGADKQDAAEPPRGTYEPMANQGIVPEYITGSSTAYMTSAITKQVQNEGLSQGQVIVYLITAMVGVGVVVLPSLMREGGWFLAPVVSFFTAIAYMEMVSVLDGTLSEAEGKMKTLMFQGSVLMSGVPLTTSKGPVQTQTISSFEDLAFTSLGPKGVMLIRTVVLPGFFGNVLVFSMLIDQNISGLYGWDRSVVVMVTTPLLICFALMKDAWLARAMSFGMVASLCACVLICVKGFTDASFWSTWPADEQAMLHRTQPKDLADVGTVLAVCFSAYSIVGTVPCVRGQMQKPEEFMGAFRSAISVVVTVYTAVMLSAYYGYGSSVQDNVIDSMMSPVHTPCEAGLHDGRRLDECFAMEGRPIFISPLGLCNSYIGILMSVLMTTYLFLGFGLFFKVFSGLVAKIGGDRPCFISGNPFNWALRISIVLGAVVIGAAVPNFRAVLAIAASICCPCNNVFFPLMFDWYLSSRERPLCRSMVHCCIVLLAMLCFTLGLYRSISNLATTPHQTTSHHTTFSNNATLANATLPR